jgi:AraC-like DNA-binding protein
MSFIEIEYREKHKPFAMTALQSHDYYEIYCLAEGDRQVFFESRMFTLTGGSICVIPPFRMHKMEGGPYRRINLYISPDLLDSSEGDFLSECSEMVAFSLTEEREKLFFSLIEAAAEECAADGHKGKKYLVEIMRTLLFLLRTSSLVPIPDATVVRTEKNDKSQVLQIIDYINCHLEQSISLDLLSEKFFVSKNTLCKRFRREMKCSVAEYISGARLSLAKNLLVTTTLPMDKIAERCGYSSANYFSLIFKKNVGISPLNYRKKK